MECYLLLAGASPRKQESLKWKKNLFAMMMVLRPVAQWNWISQTTIPDGFFFYRNRNAMNGNRIAIKIRIFQWGRQASSSQTEAMRWCVICFCFLDYLKVIKFMQCELFRWVRSFWKAWALFFSQRTPHVRRSYEYHFREKKFLCLTVCMVQKRHS